MLSKLDSCKLLGEAVATGLFADMLNPDNRGKNFTWDMLPKMAATAAENQIRLTLEPNTPKMINEARKSAIEQCNMLIERSDVKNWTNQ